MRRLPTPTAAAPPSRYPPVCWHPGESLPVAKDRLNPHAARASGFRLRHRGRIGHHCVQRHRAIIIAFPLCDDVDLPGARLLSQGDLRQVRDWRGAMVTFASQAVWSGSGATHAVNGCPCAPRSARSLHRAMFEHEHERNERHVGPIGEHSHPAGIGIAPRRMDYQEPFRHQT